MLKKIKQDESKKLDVLFGRELDVKGQFKDRLIHQHLNRQRKNNLQDLSEPSENSPESNFDD